MKGEKIGENKNTELWSLGGHTYVEVPKWVVEKVREDLQKEKYNRINAEGISYIIVMAIAFTLGAIIF